MSASLNVTSSCFSFLGNGPPFVQIQQFHPPCPSGGRIEPQGVVFIRGSHEMSRPTSHSRRAIPGTEVDQGSCEGGFHGVRGGGVDQPEWENANHEQPEDSRPPWRSVDALVHPPMKSPVTSLDERRCQWTAKFISPLVFVQRQRRRKLFIRRADVSSTKPMDCKSHAPATPLSPPIAPSQTPKRSSQQEQTESAKWRACKTILWRFPEP